MLILTHSKPKPLCEQLYFGCPRSSARATHNYLCAQLLPFFSSLSLSLCRHFAVSVWRRAALPWAFHIQLYARCPIKNTHTQKVSTLTDTRSPHYLQSLCCFSNSEKFKQPPLRPRHDNVRSAYTQNTEADVPEEDYTHTHTQPHIKNIIDEFR